MKQRFKVIALNASLLCILFGSSLFFYRLGQYHGANTSAKQVRTQANSLLSRAYKQGWAAGRVGWMQIPPMSGSVVVQYSGKSASPSIKFTSLHEEPEFRSDEAWYSDNNRRAVEHIFGRGMQYENAMARRIIEVKGVACAPGVNPNFWNCVYRELGNTLPRIQIIEMEPKTGIWRGAD